MIDEVLQGNFFPNRLEHLFVFVGVRYILLKDVSPSVKTVTFTGASNKWVNIHMCNFIINTAVAGGYADSSGCECAVHVL